MAGQVTGAAPYHLNADASYRQGYYYGDTTMYRYSDHDPIVVGLNLGSSQILSQDNENSDNEIVVYAVGKNILIHSEDAVDVTVYDLLGRTIAFRSQLQQGYITMPTAGLYLVRTGNHVKKVVVE